MQADIPVFVNHVTFRMPVLVDAVTKDFDKLLQNRGLTAVASLRELGRIVVMAVDAAFVFVVRVLRPEDCRTNGAGEMLNVVFPLERSDVRPAKSSTTRMTKQIQASKIVGLAEWILVWWLIGNRKELRGYDLVTILRLLSALRRVRCVSQ